MMVGISRRDRQHEGQIHFCAKAAASGTSTEAERGRMMAACQKRLDLDGDVQGHARWPISDFARRNFRAEERIAEHQM